LEGGERRLSALTGSGPGTDTRQVWDQKRKGGGVKSPGGVAAAKKIGVFVTFNEQGGRRGEGRREFRGNRGPSKMISPQHQRGERKGGERTVQRKSQPTRPIKATRYKFPKYKIYNTVKKGADAKTNKLQKRPK